METTTGAKPTAGEYGANQNGDKKMFKAIYTALAIIIAATTFAAAAQAGCGSKHRGFQTQSSNYQAKKAKRARIARQRAIAKKRAAAKRRAIAQRKAAAAKKARIAAAAKAKRARIAAAKRAKAKKARIAAANAKKNQEQTTNDDNVDNADNTDDNQDTADAADKTNNNRVNVAALAGADIDTDADTDLDTASNEELGCKKYIPSAGLTISVSCTQ